MIEDPPFLSRLLFENAWPSVIVLVVAAVVLPFARRRTHSLAISGVLLVAAIGAWSLARFVVTDREELQAATQELVDRVSEGSAREVTAMFAPGAVLAAADGSVWIDSVDTFFQRIERARDAYAPFTHRVINIRADAPAPNRGRSLLDVNTTVQADTLPVHTQWLFTWHKQPNGDWRVVEVRFMQINRRPASPQMLP